MLVALPTVRLAAVIALLVTDPPVAPPPAKAARVWLVPFKSRTAPAASARLTLLVKAKAPLAANFMVPALMLVVPV